MELPTTFRNAYRSTKIDSKSMASKMTPMMKAVKGRKSVKTSVAKTCPTCGGSGKC